MDIISLPKVRKLLSAHKTCVVGISGGIDSMVLLRWLAENRQQLSTELKAVHVNHQIHPDSHRWAQFVKHECDSYGMPCEIKTVELDADIKNLEYAARKARYAAFCESGAKSIMLAHHGNDQFESFLLKLFRGSGVRGLKSMDESAPCWYDSSITVIRPMLSTTRYHIEAWAKEKSIAYVEDPSNSDIKYDRNYVRKRVWPVIQERFDIADVNAIRSIQHLSESWELNTILADLDIQSVSSTDGSLEWQKIKDLGYLRIKNLILRLLDIHNVYGFSVGHIEQFAQGLIAADFDSENELFLRGFVMKKHGKRITIAANGSQK